MHNKLQNHRKILELGTWECKKRMTMEDNAMQH